MISTVAVLFAVAVLTGWHLRIRRHCAWRASADGRFYIVLGYPMLALAVYWLTDTAGDSSVGWVLGTGWALGGMITFVLGFAALNDARRRQAAASQSMESIAVAESAEAGNGHS